MKLNETYEPVELGVSDFVALLNQSMQYAFPSVVIVGELANFRVSKNRWVYFDLKDENSSIKFFGTIYQLPGPLEDGMMLKVAGQPKLHNLYGFSVNVQSMQPAGEGSIRRAADLLQAKLVNEGLFDESRKRALPYPPKTIGLVTSKQSAAYADFMKIINARWQGLEIIHIDVQVQGEPAPGQIVAALEQLNAEAETPEVIVLIRGGGSAEDLAAFSTEQVTRAVAASRVPTLVAIGHEIDVSLAELAADRRASTPSNAAELLVPDRQVRVAEILSAQQQLHDSIDRTLRMHKQLLSEQTKELTAAVKNSLQLAHQALQSRSTLLRALSPEAILQRGYAVVSAGDTVVRSINQLSTNDIVGVRVADGSFIAKTTEIKEDTDG